MNRNKLAVLAASALALGLFSSTGSSQQGLSLDGRTAVTKLMGTTVQITVSGVAGQPAALLIDLDDGPSVLIGESVPIGLTPALAVLPLGNLPAGPLTLTVNIPSDPAYHNLDLYFVAVSFHPSSPNGLWFSNGANLTIVDRNIELAGNSLGQYPHFEFVRAFIRGSAVQMAVDPTRYPFIRGQTADVYVVADKTRTQWIADPSLADVRGGGPQTVTFSGADIQSNTFTLDAGLLGGPNETGLSGDTRIGVAYDVVIDFDQDGQFDGNADLIDGYDETIAGFYVVRDTAKGSTAVDPSAGPYQVNEIKYTGGVSLYQDTYYPANIASLGRLPLVVISHGNGHEYGWYDYIGYHLASYGYIVMSHDNNTWPGSHSAALSTLENTDYIIGNQAAIGGGVLNGHIDASKITWIGHSRGADGVARAYDLLFQGAFTPAHYARSDINLISSIAPVDFGGFAGEAPVLDGNGNGSHPHDAPFHLWVAQADADVHGCPTWFGYPEPVLWYHLHERATGKRQSTSLYGVGHDDFVDDVLSSSTASGPNLIGRLATHQIMRGYLLPLVSYHIQNDVPSRDFLWRQYEAFHAVGSPTGPIYVSNLMFQDDLASGKYVIDDFQSETSPVVASSGASVTMTTPDYLEGKMFDNTGDFTWQTTDPFNGFTMDDPVYEFRSNSFGSVFSVDGAGDYHVTYDMTTATSRPRFSDFEYLSFRAAQGSRHPLTVGTLGDDTFTVTLEDGNGNQSSINIAAYGGGLEEPYQRNTEPACGIGLGWTSEFETHRIRLADFLHDGDALDLADVEKVIFQFGPSYGSTQARIGLDEIELTHQ